jgi:hypothetical protein
MKRAASFGGMRGSLKSNSPRHMGGSTGNMTGHRPKGKQIFL